MTARANHDWRVVVENLQTMDLKGWSSCLEAAKECLFDAADAADRRDHAAFAEHVHDYFTEMNAGIKAVRLLLEEAEA